MDRGQLLIESANKDHRRTSILKNYDNSRASASKKTGQSTTIGQTVKFKETEQVHKDIRQFREDSPEREFKTLQIAKSSPLMYSQLMMGRDIGLINNLYNHIMVMISSNDKKAQASSNERREIGEMIGSIEQILLQNIKIKQEINQQFKRVSNLYEIAEYLNQPPQELLKGQHLAEFIAYYINTEQQLQYLETKCQQCQSLSSKQGKSLTANEKRDKNRRCKNINIQIAKQTRKIALLQKEQSVLMSKIYKLQKDRRARQRTCSALKIKINEMQCRRSYTKMKSRNKIVKNGLADKENVSESSRDNRYVKINNLERLSSFKSIAKMVRK